MPLLMLSGALFPTENAPLWLHVLMVVNPVSHALVLLRAPFYHEPAVLFTQGGYLLGWVVALAWAAICLGLSMRRVNRREQGMVTA